MMKSFEDFMEITILISMALIAMVVILRNAIAAAKARRELRDFDITQVINYIQKVVDYVDQVKSNKYKELSPDGKLTTDQADALLNAAKSVILDNLSFICMESIEDTFGDVDKFVTVQIESYINHKRKN